MEGAGASPAMRMSYPQLRRLVIGAGLVVLAVTAAVMFARRVDTVEVVAVLLFIPIFVAFFEWKVIGGAVAAVLATAVYVASRSSAIEAVGAGRLSGVVATRAVAYLAFGLVGGWAALQLERSLAKLDLYDQVDDATGLFNARFFVQDSDLEHARSKRYQTMFSVAVISISGADLDALPRRRRHALLRDVGRLIASSIRNVDRAVHGRDDRHRFAIILPETGEEGARVFVNRFADQLSAFLASRGVRAPASELEAYAITVPGDDAALEELTARFAAIDHVEHPEHPEQTEGAGSGD